MSQQGLIYIYDNFAANSDELMADQQTAGVLLQA